MAKLEWQNALYSVSQGKTRIVPVRIDDSDMPAVLKQTLFIDMHAIGLDATIAQSSVLSRISLLSRLNISAFLT